MNERASVDETVLRVLTFRADRDMLLSLDGRHLAFGLCATWLVGMGRYWDDPRAVTLQKLGLGSVAYVFVLATVIWLVLLPLRPSGLSWRGVLTYVTLTAPPAALYAVPVERWMTVEEAMTTNFWFLATVATWRVALLFVYLVRGLRLPPWQFMAALGLPLAAILLTLDRINPDRAIRCMIDAMSGVRDRPPPTPGDSAFHLIEGLSFIAVVLALPLLIVYVIAILDAASLRRRSRRAPQSTDTPPPSNG